MEISLLFTDGSEVDISLDVNSINIEASEEEMDEKLKELISEQYPEYKNKQYTLLC